MRENIKRIEFVLAAVVVMAVVGLPAFAEGSEVKGAAVPVEARQGDIYTLATCPVSGGKLGSMGDPVVKVYDGREIRFCCAGCVPKFEAEMALYLAKADAAFTAQQKEAYPLDTCLVTGESLGSMGDPVDYVHNNRLIRLCCKGCVKGLKEESAKYLAVLDTVVKEKSVDLPGTCVVSGEKLGSMGDPIEYIVGSRVVRFCCAGCVGTFEKEPAKYLLALDKAASEAE